MLATTAFGFPRLISRGSIEARSSATLDVQLNKFPRLISRGSIEAGNILGSRGSVVISAADQPRLH